MDWKFIIGVIFAIVVITAFLRALFSGNLGKTFGNVDSDFGESFIDDYTNGSDLFDGDDD